MKTKIAKNRDIEDADKGYTYTLCPTNAKYMIGFAGSSHGRKMRKTPHIVSWKTK